MKTYRLVVTVDLRRGLRGATALDAKAIVEAALRRARDGSSLLLPEGLDDAVEFDNFEVEDPRRLRRAREAVNDIELRLRDLEDCAHDPMGEMRGEGDGPDEVLRAAAAARILARVRARK